VNARAGVFIGGVLATSDTLEGFSGCVNRLTLGQTRISDINGQALAGAGLAGCDSNGRSVRKMVELNPVPVNAYLKQELLLPEPQALTAERSSASINLSSLSLCLALTILSRWLC